MARINKNNKVWIYVGILILIIIAVFLWFVYFNGNGDPVEPSQEDNGFRGPTPEEQEELLERITGPSSQPGGEPTLSTEEENQVREDMTATSGSTLTPEEEARLIEQMSAE